MATEQEELEDKGGEEPEAEESAPEIKEPESPNADIEVPIAARPPRGERRANRVREFEQRAERAERERDEIRRQYELSRQQAPSAVQIQPQQQNPYVGRLRNIWERQQQLHKEFEIVASQPGFNEEKRQQYELRAQQLDLEKMSTVAEMNRPNVDINQIARTVAWNQFTSEHHDVFNDPKLTQWAWGEYYRRIAEGQADTRALAEDVLDAARVRFGLQSRRGRGSAPDTATRQRLSGVSSRSAGPAGGGGTISMNAHQRKMARDLYSSLPEKEAYQKWANGPGKRLLDKGLLK